MSKFIDSREVAFSNKFENYNSPEKEILLEVFEKMPMMDKWIANIVESYIYAYEVDTYDGITYKYRTKYGVKDGEARSYYETGELCAEFLYKDGKINSLLKEYWEDGGLKSTCNVVYGKIEGELRNYHSNGNLWVIENYITSGRNGEYREYWEDGTIKFMFNFVDGKTEGEGNEFYEDGQIKQKANYNNGELNGLYQTWFRAHPDVNPNISEEITFKDGKKDGPYKHYNSDGIVIKECNYIDGLLEGKHIIRNYTNGKIYIEEHYKQNLLHGSYKQWDEEGNLVREQEYVNGVLKQI
jgi:antitoxin component YwqK of YwqJK toxin-antitoxin module